MLPIFLWRFDRAKQNQFSREEEKNKCDDELIDMRTKWNNIENYAIIIITVMMMMAKNWAKVFFFGNFFFSLPHIESEHNFEYIIIIIHLNNNNLYFRLCWKKNTKNDLIIYFSPVFAQVTQICRSFVLSPSLSLSRLVVDLITIEKLFNLLLFFSHFVVDFKKTNIYKFDAKFYLIRCSKCIAVPRPSPSPRTLSKLNRN